MCSRSAVFIFFLLFTPLVFSLPAVAADVQLYETEITLPTYPLEEPEKCPIFYTGRVHQGAQGRVYPYPLLNRISDERTDKTYKVVYLENEYLKISVLPEIGGRLFTGLDKTNGYNFFYEQHVIKPALIGMLGAWVSGGIEWNVPHHHRASTFMPVDYRLEEHPDGSKTVWVGEVEPRHRMRWLVGLTLHPGKSYIEMTGRVINRTPSAHPFLFWANAAVHANDDYQVIFPPATEYATHHNKDQFVSWPVAREIYAGQDYRNGADLSWWKNIPVPSSFFAWNYDDDFFAGYDHGVDAGVVSLADHHVAPGKKAWVWGKNDQAAMWDKILTDSDGPYIELMTGAYSDNQPDYSWCLPYDTKSTVFYWYPIRGIQGLKNANLNAAANLELSPGGKLQFGFNTTQAHAAAKVTVHTSGKKVYETECDIAPDRPFSHELRLGRSARAEDVTIALHDAAGNELVRYQPVPKANAPMPEPAQKPLKPEEIQTVEELFLTGQWLEQFHNAAIDPNLYYEEALRRDPGDCRTNIQMGTQYIKKGLYEKAEVCLRTALERAAGNYTTPKDGEAYYYLGVALRYMDRRKEAYDAFGRAALSHPWLSASRLNMAELDALDGRYGLALDRANQSLAVNAQNLKALGLKTSLLRRLGRTEEAIVAATSARTVDPLDFRAANELRLLYGGAPWAADFKALLRDEVHNYLELASDYACGGLYDDAIGVLTQAAEFSRYPMVYYDLGYFEECRGALDAARVYYVKAASMPEDYCFPYQLESIQVLTSALKQCPDDAKGHYYLGNLLYDHQPQEAVRLWEQAVALDPSLAIAHRNLAFAYSRRDNSLDKAIAQMEEAVRHDGTSARYFYELDVLEEMAKKPAEDRLKRLEANQAVIESLDDALNRLVHLWVLLGDYDSALQALDTHRFLVWEGGRSMHADFVSAHLLRGRKWLAAGDPGQALEDFKAALTYPENLGQGRPADGGTEPGVHYAMGLAYEMMGDEKNATANFQKCVAYGEELSERAYYQALAHQKLGAPDRAAALLAELERSATSGAESAEGVDVFAKFGEKEGAERKLAQFAYLKGLSYLGRGGQDQARVAFEEALTLDPCHLGARTELAGIN